MARITVALAAAALALFPATALAQDKPGDGAVGYISNGLFDAQPPPPLTPEQQARLPLATALAEKVLPPGALATALQGMFGSILDPLLGGGSAGPDPRTVISRRIAGYYGPDDLTDDQAARIAEMLDPQWQERERRSRAITDQALGRLMAAMEPALRQGIAELYAINFSESELADIDAFFATPSGAAYARQSYTMASDARLTGRMMGNLSQIIEQMAAVQGELDAATADLPPQRNYADLTGNQRKLLAQWLGLSAEDLQFLLLSAGPPTED